MNEASFSRWLCSHFLKQHLFPQRLEVTTGAGIPDIALIGVGGAPIPIKTDLPFHGSGTRQYLAPRKTAWLELKWETKHIRPEQYIWGKKAENVGVNVNYVIGSEETISLFSLENAEKMAKSWKLVTEVATVPRTKESIPTLISMFT